MGPKHFEKNKKQKILVNAYLKPNESINKTLLRNCN